MWPWEVECKNAECAFHDYLKNNTSVLLLTEEHLEFFQTLGITDDFIEWFWNYH